MSPSEPPVFDVRGGLTQDVLDGFHRAERVTVAIKGPQSAAVGYWVYDRLSIALIRCESATLMRVPPAALHPPLGPQLVRAPQAPMRGVLLDIPHTRDNEFWSRVLGLVRVGDVLRIGGENDSRTLSIQANGVHVGSLRLPRKPLPEQRSQPAA